MNALRVCKLRKNCLAVIGQCAMVLKIFRASLFNDDLSNAPNFRRIHLAGQYL
jgi:hypothetical protein